MAQIINLGSVESTNRYCELLDLGAVEEFTCYHALEQTAGIGQRGNTWVSGQRGENLTFSLILKPTFLPAASQFRLTQTISLALCDLLSPLAPHHSTLIKWPNDIYIDGDKICGTLISCRYTGDTISSAICGIGLNVNQEEFPDWVPHPTSLALLTGHRHDPGTLLRQLLACIERRYAGLRSGNDPTAEYLSRLMNLGVPRRYRHEGQEITATITGVDNYGRLLLTERDGNHLCCAMKEIALVQ